jgi:hypothetical protein
MEDQDLKQQASGNKKNDSNNGNTSQQILPCDVPAKERFGSESKLLSAVTLWLGL